MLIMGDTSIHSLEKYKNKDCNTKISMILEGIIRYL